MSYITFNQKYYINDQYWGGPNSPILVSCGGESEIEDDIKHTGLNVTASLLNALLVYTEHRFYGESHPLGSIEEAMENDTIRGYFNSAQALADYAEILVHIKESLSAENSPIIAVGGSYPGMLAAWFRLKYPHVVIGALASSAPILRFDNFSLQYAYESIIVSKDFKDTSLSCYNTIRRSWAEIERVASKPNGLSILSKKFNICSPLNGSDDLRVYLENFYELVAQYDVSLDFGVARVCKAIDGAPKNTHIFDRIHAGIVSIYDYNHCLDTGPSTKEGCRGWNWQYCTEMVNPYGRRKDTMFSDHYDYNITKYIAYCETLGCRVQPRIHWAATYYGGHNIVTALKRFGSNIIFSNGLRDPFSGEGVLQNIYHTIIALTTVNGSHCIDLATPKKTDPKWLIMQREKEVEIMQGWVREYYEDLKVKGF